MKYILSLMVAAGLVMPAYAAELKEVCVDVKDKNGKVVNDAKTGKPKQSCKTIKVHKKVEGEKVPESTKKK